MLSHRPGRKAFNSLTEPFVSEWAYGLRYYLEHPHPLSVCVGLRPDSTSNSTSSKYLPLDATLMTLVPSSLSCTWETQTEFWTPAFSMISLSFPFQINQYFFNPVGCGFFRAFSPVWKSILNILTRKFHLWLIVEKMYYKRMNPLFTQPQYLKIRLHSA